MGTFSSQFHTPQTIYLYNYVRGQLSDIPILGDDKRIYVSIYSGSTGGYYTQQGGGDGEDDGRESTGFSIDDLVAEDADDDDVGTGYNRGGGVAA